MWHGNQLMTEKLTLYWLVTGTAVKQLVVCQALLGTRCKNSKQTKANKCQIKNISSHYSSKSQAKNDFFLSILSIRTTHCNLFLHVSIVSKQKSFDPCLE